MARQEFKRSQIGTTALRSCLGLHGMPGCCGGEVKKSMTPEGEVIATAKGLRLEGSGVLPKKGLKYNGDKHEDKQDKISGI